MLGGPSVHNPVTTPTWAFYAFSHAHDPEKSRGRAAGPTHSGNEYKKGAVMKSTQFFKSLFLILALATGAFAAGNAQKGSFQVSEPVQVSGTQLAAGDYVARWEGTGDSVKVEIVRNGKVLATVPAKVVELGQKASDDAAEIANNGAGRELKALRFSGKKVQLDLGSQMAGAQAKTQDSVK
jgi:hypothetical protein